MAGWGLCGVLGRAARAGAARRIGRVGLAAVCGFAGVAYGALLNFSLMATYGGELSLRALRARSRSRAVPFDAAHAIGNVTLALVAGPAMVRMLVRFRERFEWRRLGSGGQLRRRPARRPGDAALLALAIGGRSPRRRRAAAGTGRSGSPGSPPPRTATAASGPRPGDDSSISITGWAMLGLEAAGRNPLESRAAGQDPGRLPARNSASDRQQRRPRPDDPRAARAPG